MTGIVRPDLPGIMRPLTYTWGVVVETDHPHILVTNDDGVLAPGLAALAEALKAVGTVSVIAPDRNWSASGHVKTLHRPLRVDETHLVNGLPALMTDGAPSDAVALGLMGLVAQPVHLVVAGINRGANVGHDLTYSGTVTAAMEGVIGGVPAIAVSLDIRASASEDYDVAAAFAAYLAHLVLDHGLPPGVLLNVNVPARVPTDIQGVKVTRMGIRVYRDMLVTRKDPSGRPYYWIGGDPPTGVLEEGTDFAALTQGFISVTPVQMDFTAYGLLGALESWPWDRWRAESDAWK